MKELADAVRRADDLRDRKLLAEAAEAYRVALSIDPSHGPLWVQLGNMLKDTARYDAAEAAYDEAIRIFADDADVWLQRGRSQRLSGKRVEALHSFTQALRLRPGHADAITELIQLDAGWQAGQADNLGPRLLFDLLDTMAQMRTLIARVETDLPAITALNTIPLGHYDAFRRARIVSPPPVPAPAFGMSVLIRGSGPLDLMLKVLRALQEQTHQVFTVAMPDLDGEAKRAFARLAQVRPNQFIDVTEASAAEFARSTSSHPGFLLATEPVIFDREAFAWMAAALATEGAAGVLSDEDCVMFENGRPHFTRPLLRGECDLEMLEQGIDAGRIMACRTELIESRFVSSKTENAGVAQLALCVARKGRVEVIRQPLASCIDPGPTSVTRSSASAARTSDTIAVVIPTRDRLDLLVPALAAARDTARHASRLRFVIVNNGSVDPATNAYLAEEARNGRLQHLRVDEPFNWSRLNRLGTAAVGDAQLLVFMNNDVNLSTFGWDDAVASLLSRHDVGAVGAKLLYPDGTIQHAGIVVTADGRTVHDGRGEPGSEPGPAARYVTRRSVTAVTGAFLATHRRTFDRLGGFDDENLPLWFNDVDFCLKVWDADMRVVYEPAIVATHFEGKSLGTSLIPDERDALFKDAAGVMSRRWKDAILKDRWTRPNLSV